MRTGLAAFRFVLVGFTRHMFVLRPSLLMLDDTGNAAAAPHATLHPCSPSACGRNQTVRMRSEPKSAQTACRQPTQR
jgi:hypothetical protein